MKITERKKFRPLIWRNWLSAISSPVHQRWVDVGGQGAGAGLKVFGSQILADLGSLVLDAFAVRIR